MAASQKIAAGRTRGGPAAAARERPSLPRKRDRSRLKIMEAAVESLILHGYHRTSLTRVAQIAGVTRSGLQYHFPTLEALITELCAYVLRRQWISYEEHSRAAPPGRDPLEHAIDLVASSTERRYMIARLELITAARTTPALEGLLEAAAEDVDAMRRAFVDELFGVPGLSATERFTAARDLSSLVGDWLFAHVFPPGDGAARSEAVLKALRIALYTLWGRPLPAYIDQDYLKLDAPEGPALGKPRVRVKAPARPCARENLPA